MDKSTRRVTAHAQILILRHAKFIVSEAGRKRVLREKQKNVHAFIEGIWLSNWPDRLIISHEDSTIPEVQVSYNPYKMKQFQTLDGKCIKSAQYVKLLDGKVFAGGPVYY